MVIETMNFTVVSHLAFNFRSHRAFCLHLSSLYLLLGVLLKEESSVQFSLRSPMFLLENVNTFCFTHYVSFLFSDSNFALNCIRNEMYINSKFMEIVAIVIYTLVHKSEREWYKDSTCNQFRTHELALDILPSEKMRETQRQKKAVLTTKIYEYWIRFLCDVCISRI